MESIKEILYNLPLLALLAALTAFAMSTLFNLYPVIIHVSREKGLMDEPDERMAHTNKIPNLGGMGIFITFSLVILLFVSLLRISVYDISSLLSILSALIILMFLGVKDDLVLMTPKKKFLVQLIAVSMVCIIDDVLITDFHGLLGIGELPYFVSVIFTVFVFVLVINALNLIDGIDGLAASIAIMGSACFGIFFLASGYYMLSILSATLIGSLFGFLRYNLSQNKKIFMGDCGAMVVGFLLAYLGINFLDINTVALANYNPMNSPIFLLAVLSYPLFDLLRVFVVRISQQKSPFKPDNNHIHHRLIRLGLSHIQSTFLLVTINLVLVAITYFTINLPIHLSLLVVLSFGIFIYLVPFLSIFEEYHPPSLIEDNTTTKTPNDRVIENGVIALENLTKVNLPSDLKDLNVPTKKLEPVLEDKKKSFVSKRNEKFKILLEREEQKKQNKKQA